MRWLMVLVFVGGCSQKVQQEPDDLSLPPEDMAVVGDLGRADLRGAPADLATVCPCGAGQRCEGVACIAVDVMQVRLGQINIQIIDGGVANPNAVFQNMACFYHPYADRTFGAPVASAGPCNVYQQTFVYDAGPPTPLFAGGAGMVTVSGANPGSYSLAPDDAGTGCYYAMPPTDKNLFSDGQNLTVTSTGGSDFPAFTQSLTAPPGLTITTGAIQRGQPLTVAWTGSEAGHPINLQAAVYTATAAVRIVCDPEDTGSFTIPSSLTSLFPDSSTPATTAFIGMERQHLAHLEPTQKSVAIDVYIWTDANRTVSYTP